MNKDKKLIVAGITTEVCVTFPVLQALDEGYFNEGGPDNDPALHTQNYLLRLRH